MYSSSCEQPDHKNNDTAPYRSMAQTRAGTDPKARGEGKLHFCDFRGQGTASNYKLLLVTAAFVAFSR